MCTARVSKWLPWELSSVLPSDSCSQRSRGFDGILKALDSVTLLKIPRARAWESVLVGGNRRVLLLGKAEIVSGVASSC